MLVSLAFIKSLTIEPINLLVSDYNVTSINITNEDSQSNTYSYLIDDEIKKDLILSIESYPSIIEVFLDDNLIYSYEDSNLVKGINIKWIALANLNGQKLTINWQPYREDSIPPNIQIGTQNDLFLYHLNKNLVSLIFGNLHILIGLVILAVVLFVNKLGRYTNPMGAIYLGLFIFSTGLWTLTDSRVLQFITDHVATITLASFISFIFMPIFFLLFLQNILKEKKKEVRVMTILLLIYVAIISLFYLFDITSLYQTLTGTHILLIISVVIILKVSIQEYKERGDANIKKILLGISALLLSVLVALISFYFNVKDSNYSLYFNIGILLFNFYLISAYLARSYQMIEESANLEAYKKLAYFDVMTGLKNRSAFIYDIENINIGQSCACIVFDLNNLKRDNDNLGHSIGDEIIIETAHLILEVFSLVGSCYRVGGDEFVAILLDITKDEAINRLNELNSLIDERNQNNSLIIELASGLSYGEIINDSSLQKLYEEADNKMYEAKYKMKEKAK